MKRIKTFAEFVGESEPGYIEKEKKSKKLPDFCPTCGANLTENTCKYCGNKYNAK